MNQLKVDNLLTLAKKELLLRSRQKQLQLARTAQSKF